MIRASIAPDLPEREAWLRVTLIPELSGARLRRLLSEFGEPSEILAAAPSAVGAVAGHDAARGLQRGPDPDLLERTLAWIQIPGNVLLAIGDPQYPKLLLEIPDPPTVLYSRGRLELLNRAALAIVGSRNPSPSGATNARAFAEAMGALGLTIVSGLAAGVDAAAHRGGLTTEASSVAVLGTGIDRVYPARNRGLAHELAERGALISEFPLGTPPAPFNFPRRNRLISGLTRGCLVVEAALQSGSLITARLALEQGREVFAMPGSIHSPLSKGCHALIKQGAKLAECAQDILEELDAAGSAPSAAAVWPEDQQARTVLAQLGFDTTDLDTLCARTGLTPDAASAILLALELDGWVAQAPGGLYQRIR